MKFFQSTPPPRRRYGNVLGVGCRQVDLGMSTTAKVWIRLLQDCKNRISSKLTPFLYSFCCCLARRLGCINQIARGKNILCHSSNVYINTLKESRINPEFMRECCKKEKYSMNEPLTCGQCQTACCVLDKGGRYPFSPNSAHKINKMK